MADCFDAPLPRYDELTIEQIFGVACVACGQELGADSAYRGVVEGREGAMLLDANVRVCPRAGR